MADIRVNGETLCSGAKDTDAVAAGVAQARDASGAALADNAFGIMCSPLFLPTYTLVKTAADAMMGGLLGVFRTVLVFLLQAAFFRPRNSLSTSLGVRYPRAE